MTLAQIQAAIQARGFGSDTATAQIELINSYYRQIMELHRWSFNDLVNSSLVTVVGTSSVAVSSITDLDAIDAVHLRFPAAGTPTETHNLVYLSPQEFRARLYDAGFNQAGTNGIPVWWTQVSGDASAIQLLPFPDRIYGLDVDYNRNAVDLAAAGDIPVLPTKFHDLLVWGPIVDLSIRERDSATASLAQSQFDTRLGKMERKLGIHQGQSSTHIQTSSFWEQVGRGSSRWGR